jgi:hypothetical protein
MEAERVRGEIGGRPAFRAPAGLDKHMIRIRAARSAGMPGFHHVPRRGGAARGYILPAIIPWSPRGIAAIIAIAKNSTMAQTTTTIV